MSHFGVKVFVVEDDEWYARLLKHVLSLDPDHEVQVFSTGKECLDKLSEEPAIITLDHLLPDMDGLEVLEKVRQHSPDTAVIMVSGQENVATAVELLRKGAYEYLVKNEDIKERLRNIIRKIRENRELRHQVSRLQEEVERKYELTSSIIGKSKPMERIWSLIRKALSNNINVMITGETGTGKELVANTIHYNSQRKRGPFLAVNMAAIPEGLVESELFGHEKGAFTGAHRTRAGKFEEASGGTLFLDEIGELDLPFQVKLLRVLQEKQVVRVGGNKPVPVDCRVIAATNRDLQREIKEGRFREDLYYRLYGLTIDLPPLRERGQDILILAKKFMEGFCQENGYDIPELSQKARQKLLQYNYPGNVRELRSVVELAVVLAESGTIQPEDIQFGSEGQVQDLLSEELTLQEYKEKIVHAFLERYDNDVKTVARKLGIGTATVYRMLKLSS